MSEEKSNDKFDELLRFAVIGQYLGHVGKVIYNHKSWHIVQKKLEQGRLQRKRKQMRQTIGLIVVTLLLTICILLKD
jgi:hypothetical protein